MTRQKERRTEETKNDTLNGIQNQLQQILAYYYLIRRKMFQKLQCMRLKKQQLHPIHYQNDQTLSQEDQLACARMCKIILDHKGDHNVL